MNAECERLPSVTVTAFTAAVALLALGAMERGGIVSAMSGQQAEGKRPLMDLQRPAETKRAVFALG